MAYNISIIKDYNYRIAAVYDGTKSYSDLMAVIHGYYYEL